MELIDVIDIPDYAVNYVINGTKDGLTKDEIKEINIFLKKYKGYYFEQKTDRSEFSWSSLYYQITKNNPYYQGANYLTFEVYK